MTVYKAISDLIGNTPLVELTHIEEKEGLDSRVVAKVEFFNPAGSVKDRIAKKMIEDAEKAGKIKPGATLIEPTSGNTGIGIASVAAAKGYKAIMTMPETMSVERRNLLKAYGAKVVLTDGKTGMKGAIAKAKEFAFTISIYTAKKLFGYHLESGKDPAADIAALEGKVAAAQKNQTLDDQFRVVQNGQPVVEKRKLTKEEIDLSVRRVSRIVKIGMFMDRYPAELSGGQQQRVAIARTLAPEPSVLFMDEPLSNLDAKLRLEMRYELQRLHVETGSTFVYVTHDQMEAMTLATQICLINNGVLQQYDAPLTVYNKPNNLFVADFVGNPSINFVEATGAQDPDGTIPLTLLGGRRAVFRPASPVSLPDWFKARNEDIARQEAEHQKKAAQKSYVEKSNKDETFRYHIAKVVEEDASLRDDPVLTDTDLVLGIRPEFLDIADSSALEGEIYGAMPTGMESTIKVRVGDFLLTGVIFGSSLFTIGAKVPLSISGDNIMLFDRKSGRCIAFGSLSF